MSAGSNLESVPKTLIHEFEAGMRVKRINELLAKHHDTGQLASCAAFVGSCISTACFRSWLCWFV